MFLAHAGLHLNPHPPETVLYLAIGFAVVALAAIVAIRWWQRRPSDSQTFSIKVPKS
jgi:hypothetical protein